MRLHQNCGRAQIKLTNAEAAPGLISLVLAADESPAGPPFFKQLVIPVAAEVSGTVSLSRCPLGGRGNVSCGCTRRHLVDLVEATPSGHCSFNGQCVLRYSPDRRLSAAG